MTTSGNPIIDILSEYFADKRYPARISPNPRRTPTHVDIYVVDEEPVVSDEQMDDPDFEIPEWKPDHRELPELSHDDFMKHWRSACGYFRDKWRRLKDQDKS